MTQLELDLELDPVNDCIMDKRLIRDYFLATISDNPREMVRITTALENRGRELSDQTR